MQILLLEEHVAQGGKQPQHLLHPGLTKRTVYPGAQESQPINGAQVLHCQLVGTLLQSFKQVDMIEGIILNIENTMKVNYSFKIIFTIIFSKKIF